MNNDH